MALAFVLSKEPDPSGIAAFLDQPTMGIVEAASLYRHPTPGHRAKRSGADPFTHLRSDPPIASLGLDTLPFAVNGPIALILERNDVAWLVRAAVKELPAIRRLISSVKQTAIPNIQNSR